MSEGQSIEEWVLNTMAAILLSDKPTLVEKRELWILVRTIVGSLLGVNEEPLPSEAEAARAAVWDCADRVADLLEGME